MLADMTADAARLAAAAREIARMPQVAERLRETHVAGPDGRCLGCPSATSVAPIWPCTLRLLAGGKGDAAAWPD